jgi:integrase/recombinase XerD
MLSWLAGMRVAEIAALRISDVSTTAGEVRAEIQLSAAQTKGNAARTVLVGSQLKSELEAYLRSLPEPPAPDWPLIASKTGRRFSANGFCQVMQDILRSLMAS